MGKEEKRNGETEEGTRRSAFLYPLLLHLHDLIDPQCHEDEPSLSPWRLRFNNFIVHYDQPAEVGLVGGC